MVHFNTAEEGEGQMVGQYSWAQSVSFQLLKKRAFLGIYFLSSLFESKSLTGEQKLFFTIEVEF